MTTTESPVRTDTTPRPAAAATPQPQVIRHAQLVPDASAAQDKRSAASPPPSPIPEWRPGGGSRLARMALGAIGALLVAGAAAVVILAAQRPSSHASAPAAHAVAGATGASPDATMTAQPPAAGPAPATPSTTASAAAASAATGTD